MPKYAKLYENYFRDICAVYNEEAHPEHPLKVTPHVCRHTFCTSLAMLDVNPIKLQKIMGHTDLKTTAGYLMWTKNEIFQPYASTVGGFFFYSGLSLSFAKSIRKY